MKFHFITSVAFVIVLTFQVLLDDRRWRIIFLIPDLLLFYGTFLLFAYEYDKEKMEMWKKREKKRLNKTYTKFFDKKKKKKKKKASS